ncbi:MAG: response regulator [Terriglobales bacterium]
MLIDDEPSILRTWQAILDAHDIEAVCCDQAAIALVAIAEGCDCVITDYHMDDMTGIEVVTAARAIGSAPVLLMTGDDSPALRAAAMAAGAAGVIGKPMPVRVMIEEIEKLL